MAIVANGIVQVAQLGPLQEMNDFKRAGERVSELRYALIDEMRGLTFGQPLEKLSKEIQNRQKLYSDLVKECQAWEWKCVSHICNPKSEMAWGDQTAALFPDIQRQAKAFSAAVNKFHRGPSKSF